MRYTHRNEFFGGLVYDRISKDYFYLDQLANRIVRNPQMTLSHEEREVFDTNEEEIEELRDRFRSCGMFDNIKFLNNATRPSGLSAPIRIFFEITYRCPERCKHCYTDSSFKDPAELTFEQKRSLIDQMVEMGCFRMSIAGGEPLIDADFFPLVEYALDHGVDISFSTSGIPITDDIAQRLEALDIRTVNISLDGWNEETFGIVRGKGRLPFMERGVR